jgi:hypothetical protein
VRLVIGGPTLAMVPAPFAVDFAALYATTRQRGPWTSVTLCLIGSTYVHVGREVVLAGALERHATHILWIDTDMTFPEDTAIRLAAHNKPIVAANCVMKTIPPLCTAWRDGARVETTETSSGLAAVDWVGMAIMLMRTAVVADLPRPWFPHGTSEAGRDVGEDVMFCRALRAAGHEILIDHDLSKEIGHIGSYTYRPDCAALAVQR